MQESKEWFIEAPWGILAVISHGNPRFPKVLLIHGREDSAATFEPLLQLLPERYYVALDLPGHGKSDPLPVGLTLCRIHFVGAVDVLLKHLQWDHFTVIAHSLGCELALFYNIAYPGRIKKLILLDAGPSLQRLQVHDPAEYRLFYQNYYDNYDKNNKDDRVYSMRKAVEAVMKARGLTEQQAEIVLKRNLKKIGEDLYKLSWDRRIRFAAPQNYPVDYYLQLFSAHCPPTLLLHSSLSSGGYEKGKEAVKYLLSEMQKLVGLKIIDVEGSHDVHLTHPERVAHHIAEFINETNCKL